MVKNLVIVESPAKARTIEGFLGKDFTVKSCFGHVRDLSKKDLSIDVENGFAPIYEVPVDKKKVVSELKDLAKKAEMIWLASDEDREGEAISWHLVESLSLDADKVKRIVFHEITKNAILDAIKKPRAIDKNLVDAQQARRILDRLVGYEISPILWKKVKPALSAGRVQSVAVRLIVDREREINAFASETYFRVTAEFDVIIDGKKAIIRAELEEKFKTEKEVDVFLEGCKSAKYVISNVEIKPAKKSPAPPFTTSTLQQEASRKLGFSVARTMTVAQQLYESGKITYMRTDSVSLSDLALGVSKSEIQSQFGPEYYKFRKYATKTKGAQEAHEAIRPTYLNHSSVDGDAAQKKLYDLIWKRTIASQMSDAEIERTTVSIDVSGSEHKFISRGEVIRFDGFLKVYMESSDDEDENGKNVIPPVKAGLNLDLKIIESLERLTKHLPRYSEASLVKKLEELGIGRPSTYAPIISTVQKRGYVVAETRPGEKRKFLVAKLEAGKVVKSEKEETVGFEKSKLFPTDIGMVVNDFLVNSFAQILDFNFTAQVEKNFDDIAQGEMKWNVMIADFYTPFHKIVEETSKTAKRVSGERHLGIDPATGKNVFVKIGRYGPVVQLGDNDENERPRFAGILKNQSMEKILLEEALELFRLPKNLGEFEGAEVVVGTGKFGPFVRHGSLFFSIPKTDNPLEYTLNDAILLVEEKRKKDSERIIREFEDSDVRVLKGRWGPYIAAAGKNYRLPKGTEPEKLGLEECQVIINNQKSETSTKKKK
ncbi:MAG: type I DNA topoisomerase [Bacteroidetes bacterium]|nr:type I DNA topoisomerase [Bacteroidota bacterium]